MKRNVLAQYHHYWKHHIVYKNQIIYKEGQKCTHVYLIKSGEFELFINIKNGSLMN